MRDGDFGAGVESKNKVSLSLSSQIRPLKLSMKPLCIAAQGGTGLVRRLVREADAAIVDEAGEAH